VTPFLFDSPLMMVNVPQVAASLSGAFAHSPSETSLLFFWGITLLLAGRRLARRSHAAPADAESAAPALSRMRTSTGSLEAVL
jgi:hypothetical protein